MNKKLRILILEDVETDAELTEHEIKKAKLPFISKRVAKQKNFSKALKSFKPELASKQSTLSALLTSGYVRNTNRNIQKNVFIFIEKPYVLNSLLTTLRQTIEKIINSAD